MLLSLSEGYLFSLSLLFLSRRKAKVKLTHLSIVVQGGMEHARADPNANQAVESKPSGPVWIGASLPEANAPQDDCREADTKIFSLILVERGRDSSTRSRIQDSRVKDKATDQRIDWRWCSKTRRSRGTSRSPIYFGRERVIINLLDSIFFSLQHLFLTAPPSFLSLGF